MGSYLPNTEAEQRDMLREAGYDSFDALFSSIPASVRLSRPLDLPAGISELEARAAMEDMAAAQVGKSEVGNNWVGYTIDHDPGPMLFVEPTIDMAEKYSKQRLAPMIEMSEVLREKIPPPSDMMLVS